MATVSVSPGTAASPIATVDASDGRVASSLDWAAIIAGGVLATAITFILITFGTAIGLGMTSPYEGEGSSLAFLAIAAGLWLVWVQVSSFIAGGYLAGRMRRRLFQATPHEVEVRDGCHGLMVWAVGVLVGATLAASLATGAARTGAAVISSAGDALGSGAAAVAENVDPMGYSVDTLFRSDSMQGGQQDAAASAAEAGRILARSAAQGSISADDKTYLARIIQARTGVDQAQAEQRINQVMTTIQSAAEQAKAAADKARRTGVIVAFVTAASLVISAAAAWWAAGLGGRHRDEGLDFSHLVRWR